MANLDDLYSIDDRIQAVENHQERILVSLAGPGTGKTYSFLRRIRYLTEVQEEDPASICYLTFIKEITKAFILDYQEEFGAAPDAVIAPRVSTLHSFACRLIRNRGFMIGYDGPLFFFNITQTGEIPSDIFIEDLLPYVAHFNTNTSARLRKALNHIKTSWREDLNPADLDDPVPAILDICLHLLYRVMDWDQTVPTAHNLYLDENNRQEWILRINHYLIDEFQDFNIAEQRFIEALADSVRSMVIVGDDNQSLYGSRGGSPEGMREIFRSGVHDTVILLRCRRCRSSILERSNTFLRHIDPHGIPLIPYYEGGQVRCFRFKSSKAELSFLSEFLQSRIDELPEDPSPKDGIVCLFPTKKLLEFYFDSLKDIIPCHVRGTSNDARRTWLSLALRLVLHPNQRFIERQILQTFNDIKPRHRHAVVNVVLENDISPVEAVAQLVDLGELSGKAGQTAVQFIELCQALSSQNPELFSDYIHNQIEIDAEILLYHLTAFVVEIGEVDQDESISNTCDLILPDTTFPAEDPRSILFITMHGSKGLTRNTVVMPGLEDSWLPGQSEGEELEEKARLFYVALTRAKNLVQITYPRYRAKGDPHNYPTPGRGEACRFIDASGITNVYHE